MPELDKPRPYWNPYVAGVALGLVLLTTFVVMGRGLGASGAMTRVAAYGVHKVDAVLHGGTRAESSTVATRNDYLSKYVSADSDPFDDFLIYMFFGVLAGGFIGGIRGHRFKLKVMRGERTTNTRRILLAILGGVLSAWGARLARGCTSGQALTGGATLAVGSWVFMFAVFAGGYALAYFLRKEWT
jgi:uncharacterized membrane protein YedE/YeeE